MRRNPVFKLQKLLEPLLARGPEATDPDEGIGPGHDRADRQSDNVEQRMLLMPIDARVRYVVKMDCEV